MPEDAFAERDAPGAYTYEEEAAELWEEIAAEYAGACQERATDRKIFELFANDIVYISMMLTAQDPDAFIPYFFPCCYHVLTALADVFDIQLPPTPGRRDYVGRFRHYFELCRVLQAVRKEMMWSSEEFCAFLYDYGPKSAGGLNWLWQELPPPHAAYVIGASPEDPAFRKTDADVGEKEVFCWQGALTRSRATSSSCTIGRPQAGLLLFGVQARRDSSIRFLTSIAAYTLGIPYLSPARAFGRSGKMRCFAITF